MYFMPRVPMHLLLELLHVVTSLHRKDNKFCKKYLLTLSSEEPELRPEGNVTDGKLQLGL